MEVYVVQATVRESTTVGVVDPARYGGLEEMLS